jgi:hypothetical protein
MPPRKTSKLPALREEKKVKGRVEKSEVGIEIWGLKRRKEKK